jgi:hypothetical protein
MLEYEARIRNYHITAEDQAWLVRRLAYYASQVVVFLLVALRIGPNLILFHSPLSPGPADYVQFTKDDVPMIAAIKAYKRDFGTLPAGSWNLPPAYEPANYRGGGGEILNTTSITFTVGLSGVLEYEFNPASEGWIIHSPRYDGRIPAPIVQAAPKPTSQPVTQSLNAPHGN